MASNRELTQRLRRARERFESVQRLLEAGHLPAPENVQQEYILAFNLYEQALLAKMEGK